MIKQILLLEDDETLSAGIVMALERENYEFIQCFTLAQAEYELERQVFDLLLMDVNLPDGSGFELCRRIRKKSRVPIILLTAREMELDIVTGLESGADDYITKPFSLMVLRARIHAMFRRFEPSPEDCKYQAGPFCFDFMKMLFLKKESPIDLSKTEQRLLYLFVTNQNITLSRAGLLERIWPDGTEYVDDNALSVAIRRLRDKLEDNPSKPDYIKTVYGLGYVWVNRE